MRPRFGIGLALALATGWLTASCGLGPLDVVDMPDPIAGLVAHWSFDEGGGTSVPDHSVNGFHGALTGGTWITDGRFGGALYLTRGDFVTVPGFPAATSDWTVSAWVRYAQADIGLDLATIVSTEIPSTGGWELQGPVNATTSKLQFSYNSGGRYNTLTCCPIQPDQWMHMTAVVDSQTLTMSLYQGGNVQAQQHVQAIILPGNSTLHIGIEQTPAALVWPFQGAVDEIRLYDRALNSAEISRLDLEP